MDSPPTSGVFETPDKGGVVYEYVNANDVSVDVEYASVTAPKVVRCDVTVDGRAVDTVWAGGGGSHSWWALAGGRFLRHPLKPGQTLRVKLSGKGAFRIGWQGNEA